MKKDEWVEFLDWMRYQLGLEDYNMTGVKTMRSLDLSGYEISSLEDLPEKFPPQLLELNLKYAQIAGLPELPEGLEILILEDSEIEVIESLPSNLKVLDLVDASHLKELPEELPKGLLSLSLSGSKVKCLPKLPKSLEYLDLASNFYLGNLEKLPKNLKYLNLRINKLMNSIPKLPKSLEYLHVGGTGIECLGELPKSLTHLVCWRTRIKKLIGLKKTMVEDLDVRESLIKKISLPKSIIYLSICDTPMEVVPRLPNNIYSVHCNGKSFKKITNIPKSLLDFNCSSSLKKSNGLVRKEKDEKLDFLGLNYELICN